MKIEEINTVCFIGAGTMGCFNSLLAAVGGYHAVLYDVSGDALNQAPETLREMAALLVEAGTFSQGDIPHALARITVNSLLEANIPKPNRDSYQQPYLFRHS